MKRALLFSAFVIIISCNRSNYIPGDIIKPMQMQSILWDMIRGDILAREFIKHDSTGDFKIESFTITEKILVIHNTTRKKFDKSITFYERHPGLMRIIFDSLHAVQTKKNSPEAQRKRMQVKDKKFSRSNRVQ